MMEFNPDKNRLGFYKQEEEIQLDDSHFEPLFFANDIEELRNNQNARKALFFHDMYCTKAIPDLHGPKPSYY